jgi:RHS repeat-associated protein
MMRSEISFLITIAAEEVRQLMICLTGKDRDTDLGLYYFGARWYDPEIGRWISREPTGIDGLNLYTFCHNNAVNSFDPNGLADARGLDVGALTNTTDGPVYVWSGAGNPGWYLLPPRRSTDPDK